jgi:hypothetical protein
MKRVYCLALVVFSTSAAFSELITFEFRGAIEERDGPLPAPFQDVAVGDPFSLSYSFDPDTPDLNPDDTSQGWYATTGYELTAGGASQSGVTDIDASIFLYLDEQRHATVFYDEGLTIAGILDFEPGTFSTDALPSTLNLGLLTDALFDFGNLDGFARGRITTIIVPEPAGAAMLIAGLLVLRRR